MSNKFNIPKDKVLLGLRRMAARQKNGETFSYAEIAKECGVDEKAIRKAEAKAMEKLKQKLAGCSGEVLEVLRASMQGRGDGVHASGIEVPNSSDVRDNLGRGQEYAPKMFSQNRLDAVAAGRMPTCGRGVGANC